MSHLKKNFLDNGYIVLKNKINLNKYNFINQISLFDDYLGIKSDHIKNISKRIDYIADKSSVNRELKKKFKEIYIGIFQRSILTYNLAANNLIINLLKKLGLKQPYLASDPLLMLSGQKIDNCLGMITHSPIHQDWASMQSSQNSIVIWIPLTNYGTKEFSTITIWPKSHKYGLRPLSKHKWFGAIHEKDESLLNNKSLTLKGKPGDLILFSSLLLHKTAGIKTNRSSRITLQFRYGDYTDSLLKNNKGYFNYDHCKPLKTIENSKLKFIPK